MIKKFGLLALILCLFLTILTPAPVQAQAGLTILSNSAKAGVPSGLDFNISAQSNVNITDIRLCYTVDRASFAQVTSEGYVVFTPSTTVNASWTLEMVKIGGLPPGSTVKYWWRVKDASGKEIETTPAQVQYDDLRYSWHSLTEGKVTIYWYNGDNSFAQELMSAAQQAEQKLVDDAACLPVYFSQSYILVKPYVKGYNQNPLGFAMLNGVSVESH